MQGKSDDMNELVRKLRWFYFIWFVRELHIKAFGDENSILRLAEKKVGLPRGDLKIEKVSLIFRSKLFGIRTGRILKSYYITSDSSFFVRGKLIKLDPTPDGEQPFHLILSYKKPSKSKLKKIPNFATTKL